MDRQASNPVSMDEVARYFNAPAAPSALNNAEMIAALTEVHSWARDLPIPTRGACSAMQKVRAVLDALAAAPVAAQAGQVAVPEDVLRVVRRLLDGSQPQDVPGALMVIDSALKGTSSWTYDIAPPPGFLQYVQANYNGDVNFHDSAWHAQRLWNAAMRNAKPPFAAAPSAPAVEQQVPAQVQPDWISVGARLPSVPENGDRQFIIACRRANGKTYVFAASYLNALELDTNDDGDAVFTGWYTEGEHPEYSSWYEPVCQAGDEVTHWRELPPAPPQASTPAVRQEGGDHA